MAHQSNFSFKGLPGELGRFAGDMALSQAVRFAEQHNAVVCEAEGINPYRLKGLPAILVFDSLNNMPDDCEYWPEYNFTK